MEAKRRQQQLCVQALHHQPVNNHCTHGAPLSYLPSPWVMWDAGRLAEANRRRKQKKRLCTACLLAGVAIAVLAVAGVAGLAVYLGGSPPTDGSTKWESFRRAGEARPGEEVTTHRIHNRHGILLRAESTERTTPPARSPWAIRREEGVRWEGRGGGTSASPGETPREDHVDFPYEESEGVPEIEVVLEGREGGEPLSDRSADGDAQEDETESHSARSPFARASEGRRPPVAPSAHLPETSGSPFSPPAEDRESFVEGGDKEWATTATVRESSAKDVHPKQVEEGEKGEGVRRRNHWHWDSAGDEDGGIYGTSSEEAEESGEVGEREEEEEGLEGDGGEGEEEEEMSEEEREGGEERRQQQASNKVATEGIPVFNMLTKILKRLNSSSIPKEAEVPNLNNGTIECSPGQFRCATANEGIMCLPASSRCDGVRDCTLSGEDETGCNCADTLRSRFLHRKLCDGVPDCWDYSDEDQCAWCTPGHLVCGGGARICVEPERICDGVKDCPGGDDESRCIALSSGEEERETKMLGPEARRVYQRDRNWSSSARSSDHVTASMVTNEVLPYRSSGYLLVRKKGVWGKLCLDESESKEIMPNNDSIILSWNAAEIGYKVCKAMTHRDFEAVEEVTDDEKFKGINSTKSYPPYYQLQQISSNTDILESMQSLHTTECSSKKVMRVKCKDLECGVRPKIRLNQWSRIVGGGNAAPGAWPWQAALYREGEFQCGATLISDHWLVSAGHCFFHARDDYWVARLGTLRRGTDLPSPHEQRRPVSSVILHPGYVDAGFLNDIALLRLSSPVEITDHVRPACLPPRAVHIQMPSIQVKDVYQTTTEEGISFAYDENVTTFSPLLNTYESITTEMNTDVPNTGEDLNDLKGNTPTKDISLWESTLEEGNDYTDVVTESNSTSTQHYVSYEEKRTTNIMGEHLHKQPEEEYSIPTFTSTKNSEYNPTLQVVVHAAYASINNQDPNTETTTPPPHIYSEVNNKDEAVEYKNENNTFSLESSNSQTQDIGKTIYFNTESFSLVTESMTPQYMSTNPIPEEAYLKDLSTLETSTYQSSSQRLTNTDAVTSNQNVIQAGESKEKHEKDYGHSDESVKVTLSDTDAIPNYQNHRVQVESVGSTIIYSTVNLDSYSNDTKDIITEEQPIDFSVSKTSDSYPLRSKTQAEHDIINKKVSESLDVTSPNTLKIEQVHKYVKHHKKSQDNSNILLSDEKLLETKNVNKTLPMVPDVHDEVKNQEKLASVDSFPLATEPITLDATMKETSAESIKQSVKVREARDADTDDGADDGIRNGRLCTVVGWGQLFEVGRIFPDTLQEVELPLISTKECRKRTLFLPLYHLTDAMFCAGYDRGGRDACLGDSGGPLMCQESDGHWSLYGVTSNGYGCARANRPGVYTKVSHYIPWMEEAMAREDEAQEEQQKEEERRGKEAVGEGEGWRQRWEWRRRRGEEQGVGGGKHFCPHRCPLGECLQRARLCNGVVDCSDASDEQSCQEVVG